MVVHLLLKCPPRLGRNSQLQPGTPTAPTSDDLPLLSSDPGGVCRLVPRRTQPSSPLEPPSPETNTPREGVRPRCSGLRVRHPKMHQGTASSPSSTTANSVVEMRKIVKKSGQGVWAVTRTVAHCSLATVHLQRRGRDLNPRGLWPTRSPIVRTRPDYATSPSSVISVQWSVFRILLNTVH